MFVRDIRRGDFIGELVEKIKRGRGKIIVNFLEYQNSRNVHVPLKNICI